MQVGPSFSPASPWSRPWIDIHYREYKILLRPERFFDPHQFVEYWKKVCAVAPDFKVGIENGKEGFKRHVREVLFYDTPDYELYRNAFILRKRTYYTDGWPEPERELVVEVPPPDLATAADVDVTLISRATPPSSSRKELLPLKDQVGGMRSLYSHKCVLLTPGLTPRRRPRPHLHGVPLDPPLLQAMMMPT